MTTTAVRCTVCGSRERHPVIYGCRPFTIDDPISGPFTSPDVWLVCPTCLPLVEGHDLPGLTDRMTAGLAAASGDREAHIRPSARRVIAAFHALRDETPTERNDYR